MQKQSVIGCILSSFLLTGPAFGAQPTWRVEGGSGINIMVPTAQVRLGYLLPIWDDHVEVNGTYSFFNPLLATQYRRLVNSRDNVMLQFIALGARFYPFPQAEERFFLAAEAGLEWTPGLKDQLEPQITGPVFLGGAGMEIDLFDNPHFNLNLALMLGWPFPYYLRPEFGFRVRF